MLLAVMAPLVHSCDEQVNPCEGSYVYPFTYNTRSPDTFKADFKIIKKTGGEYEIYYENEFADACRKSLINIAYFFQFKTYNPINLHASSIYLDDKLIEEGRIYGLFSHKSLVFEDVKMPILNKAETSNFKLKIVITIFDDQSREAATVMDLAASLMQNIQINISYDHMP